MSETKHPPIPPNCEYFKLYEYSDKSTGWTFQLPAYDTLHLIDAHLYGVAIFKRIIACVAAQYWRMEEQRILNDLPDEANLEEYVKAGKEREVAQNNHDAWLKWGGLE